MKFWDEVPYATVIITSIVRLTVAQLVTFGYKRSTGATATGISILEELDKYTEGYADENGASNTRVLLTTFLRLPSWAISNTSTRTGTELSTKDRVPIGYTNVPRVSYGLNVSLNYKWFDFTVFLQGVGKYSSYYSGQGVNENIYQGTFFKYHKTAWTAERYAAGQKITYPRLSTGETCSKIENDFFVMDRAFIRLKAIELGYTLPSNALRAIGINKLRVYFRGDNLVKGLSENKFDRPRTNGPDRLSYREDV